jgi:beta-lactamase superfamily II metal-dependent hydrolase
MNLRTVTAAALAATIAATTAWVLASRPDGRLHLTILNTGSSTAVLVRSDDGSTVLVDGGSSPTGLLAALGRVMPPASTHLDMVVLTGGEAAAVNGLNGLPGHYTVGTVVTPGGLTPGANTIVAALEGAGANVLNSEGGGWSFGGSVWRCFGFIALATARTMCVLTIDDPSGRALILGDAGTADQEDLCAVYGSELDADLVVTPPGGAVSPVLLATVRPRELAVPIAKGAPASPPSPGYPTDRTSTDGDLGYSGEASGFLASQ